MEVVFVAWPSGWPAAGGRLGSERYLEYHYTDALVAGGGVPRATRTFRLRIEIEEPELTPRRPGPA